MAAMTDARARSFDVRYVATTLAGLVLPLWFAVIAVLTFSNFASHGILGIDVRLYRNAAVAAFAGGNPWAIQPDGYAFAGPPPTLLFYLPTAFVPLPVATIAVMGLGLAAAVYAVRALRLPMWWLLFPPLFTAVIVGNADALLIGLLLVPGRAAGLAAVLKVYAFIPLVAQRRWGAVAVAVGVSLASLPLVPAFLQSLQTVTRVLDTQTAGLSAWGTWFLIPTLLALAVLRRRGAEWLVVPAIWPNTQDHYGAISLPAIHRDRIAAALIGLNVPLAPAVAVVVMAVRVAWQPRAMELLRRYDPRARDAAGTTTTDA
jgi:hypothetical protein